MDTQIRFQHIQFTDIDYKVTTFKQEVTEELKTSLEFSPLSDDENNRFAISFTIVLENDLFKLRLTAVAHFITNQAVDGDFISSSFVKINAPAIAFPYVRTFISNFTLNSGYNPVMLPAFNFVKLAEGNEKNEYKVDN